MSGSGQNTSLLIRSPNDLLYSYYLSSAYRSTWVYEPSIALARDPDIWEVVRRDPVIMSSMERRKNNLVKPYHCEPPRNSNSDQDKRAAGICEDAIGQIARFDAGRKRLADAHFLGRVYLYVEGDYKYMSLDGGPDMLWWVPLSLKDIDRRRFHLVADWHRRPDGTQFKTIHLEMYSTDRGRWEPVSDAYRENLIEYVYGDTEDRVGYGRGLLEATYFYHYFKTVAFEKIMQGLDRWANGILIANIDGALNGSTGKTNEDLRKGAMTMLRSMRSEHVAVVQKGDEVQVVETSGTGHEIGMSTVKYLDEGIERLYNGSLRPAGHGSDKSGARAQSETEEDTSEMYYQPDRDDIDECIDSSILKLFWDHPQNRLNMCRLRIGQAKRPKFHSRQEKKESSLEALEAMNLALDHGADIKRHEYYERSGLSMPATGDDVIKGRTAPDPMSIGLGGLPGGSMSEQVPAEPNEEQKPPEPVQPNPSEAKFERIESEIHETRAQVAELLGAIRTLAAGPKEEPKAAPRPAPSGVIGRLVAQFEKESA